VAANIGRIGIRHRLHDDGRAAAIGMPPTNGILVDDG